MFERIRAELKEIYAAIKDDTPRCVGCGRCGASIPSKDPAKRKEFTCILYQRKRKQ
jgi:hypothetical protein